MSDRTTSGREYFEWVELSQSFCSNRFGDGVESSAASGLCQAALSLPGDEKCHNTLSTCARTDNYVESSLVLRFCKDGPLRPNDGEYYFPLLTSARITPSSINPGVGNRDKGALGTRAQLSATFRDGPHPDTRVDPYLDERLIGAAQYDGVGYNPFERSTFWRKWAARNLYKLNRKLVHCGGYIDADGTVSDVVRREFWVSGFSGPNSDGSVSIEAQDILARVADEKAQIPTPSTGKLDAAITEYATTATLTPAGVGDDEYPASGWVCIGDEVVEFTRSTDTLTLVTRGDFGTTPDDHDTGATVQVCARFDAQLPSEILQTVLPYAGIDVSEYCDLAQWADETYTFLPRLYSTLIPRPIGVYQLISEVQEQMYLYIWLDERDGLIKLRSIRPAADETVTVLTEDSIASLSSRDQPEQRISRVVVNYSMRDYSRGVEDASNLIVTDVVGAFIEETPERSGGAVTRVINSRWLDSADGAAAVELGEKILARYKIPPRKVTLTIDAKDRDIWVGDFVAAVTTQHVDRFGIATPIPLQVMAVSEDTPGHSFRYEAQQFVYDEPSDPNVKSIDISGDVVDINLRDLYDSKYGVAPDSGDTVNVRIRPGVRVGSTSVLTPAIATGAWPAGLVLTLRNEGYILGKGGAGGSATANGTQPTNGTATAPEAGGTAFEATFAIEVDNSLGVIGGGGGGGGCAYWDDVASFATACATAGGGGGGYVAGAGGTASAINIPFGGMAGPGSDGSSTPTVFAGGLGGSVSNPFFTDIAYGGAGGDVGQPGTNAYTSTGLAWTIGGAGGGYANGAAAGAAVVGDSFITWTATGDRRGTIS